MFARQHAKRMLAQPSKDSSICHWHISPIGSRPTPKHEKGPTQGRALFMVAGVGLEPTTLWL